VLPNLLRHLSRTFSPAPEGRFNMILSTTPPKATLYSIVNVIGQDLTPKPSKFEESLLENFLPFPQEPKLIFAELAQTIFIPHRMDNKLGHVPRGM
jgi:hypothetical protein